MRNKKAQEEMVGFVLVIVLVIVIVLVFIGISMTKPKQGRDSSEIESFLYASLKHTSSCKPNEITLYNLRSLAMACYDNEECLDGNNTCQVLEKEYKEIIEESWSIGPEKEFSAYLLKVSIRNDTLIETSKGNKTGTYLKKEVDIPVSGENIQLRLELYY